MTMSAAESGWTLSFPGLQRLRFCQRLRDIRTVSDGLEAVARVVIADVDGRSSASGQLLGGELVSRDSRSSHKWQQLHLRLEEHNEGRPHLLLPPWMWQPRMQQPRMLP